MTTESNRLRGFISTTIRKYLNEHQNAKTNTEANIETNINNNFRKWFSGSKIVDKSGNPLEVYHGSPDEFDKFMGDTYFTEDYFNADGYAGDGTVYEVYLSIKNPIIIDGGDKKWDNIETQYGISTREVVANVDRGKHDGIIFINIKDAWFDDEDYQDASTVYVSFKSNQIKSVENDGSWDKNDNNIYS